MAPYFCGQSKHPIKQKIFQRNMFMACEEVSFMDVPLKFLNLYLGTHLLTAALLRLFTFNGKQV